MFTLSYIPYVTDYLPAEEVAFATIYSGGLKEGEAERVRGRGPRAVGVQSYCPFTPCHRTPADCRIVLHKCLLRGGRTKPKINWEFYYLLLSLRCFREDHSV